VRLLHYADLDDAGRQALDAYFSQTVFPVLTPLAFDPGRPFPHISNLSLNLAVVVKDADGVEHFARLKVLNTLPQLVPVPPGNDAFVLLERVIVPNLQALFPGLEVVEEHRQECLCYRTEFVAGDQYCRLRSNPCLASCAVL
jgi:polyphosphate kinase